MITGSITFNNLSDVQLTQVMEAKDHHEGKLFFTPGLVREGGTSSQPMNNNVVVGWNNDEGFRAALELSHRLLGETSTVAPIA